MTHLEEVVRRGNSVEQSMARSEIRRTMETFLAKRNLSTPSLSLPFVRGRWKITQGNSTEYSHSGKNQFSWDFELVDLDGFRHPLGVGPTEHPRENYSYGQPIYAARAGRVWIQDGGQDGGAKSNLIVIHHGDGTRAIYDHIRPGGFECKTGDTVEHGERIGFVGYTGVSYPHLHFSVRRSKLDDWTLPVRFTSYYLIDPKSRRVVEARNGAPLEGQIIAATQHEATGPSVPTWESSGAPDDASLFRGHSYRYYGHKLDWGSARRVCERLGGHLVTITSRREDGFVAGLVPELGRFDRCWIGLSDAERHGVWRWVTGEPFQYADWGKRQPDNMGGSQHSGQIGFNGHKQWSDGDGSGKHPFVCEWE
ncbi:MAG: peptidoglycan DD-metalloendopeptidase family protein [bacterium]|nr:peptidoglycan DD-metalloendopeptidase family protein [bacterium]